MQANLPSSRPREQTRRRHGQCRAPNLDRAAATRSDLPGAAPIDPRGYFFGITVPPDFPQTESGREIRRGYALTVAVAFVLGLALGIIVPQAMPAAVFLPIFASTGAFFYARHHVKPFSTSARRPAEAEVGGGESLPTWTLLGLPPFAVPAIIAAYLRSHWDEIPARFPVHWGWDGQPNRRAARTTQGVYGPLWFAVAIMALMAVLALVMFYGSRRSPLRIAVLKIMIGVEYLFAFIFAIGGLLPLQRFYPAALILPIVLFVGALLAICSSLRPIPISQPMRRRTSAGISRPFTTTAPIPRFLCKIALGSGIR